MRDSIEDVLESDLDIPPMGKTSVASYGLPAKAMQGMLAVRTASRADNSAELRTALMVVASCALVWYDSIEAEEPPR